MEKIKILVADNIGNGNRKGMLENALREKGINAEIIVSNEYNLDFSSYFNIAIVDWNIHRNYNRLKSDHICLLSNNENIEVPRYAMQNNYSFMYKPLSIEKATNLILNYANY